MDRLALNATLHCLSGCALGEITGLIIGEALGWSTAATLGLAVGLAFLFGYSLSIVPLLRARIAVGAALGIVLAADTLSIATMELVDNTVMALVPGAMEAGLVNPVFWLSMSLALVAAFGAAYPVNRALLRRGKGHAVIHSHHDGMEHQPANIHITPLLYVIIGLLVGGLVVATAAETIEKPEPHSAAPASSLTQLSERRV